jgi:hypothetical protein
MMKYRFLGPNGAPLDDDVESTPDGVKQMALQCAAETGRRVHIEMHMPEGDPLTGRVWVPAGEVTPTYHAHKAERADRLLKEWKRLAHEDGAPDEDTVRDMFQDCLHWLARQAGDKVCEDAVEVFAEIAATCELDFPLEIKEAL